MNRFTSGSGADWMYRSDITDARFSLHRAVTKILPLLCFGTLVSLPGCNGPTQPQFIDQPVPVRPVRVRLVEDASDVDLAVSGPYVITDERDTILRQSSSSEPFKVIPDKAGILIEGRLINRPSLCIKPTSFGTVQVEGRKYRGWLRVVKNRSGSGLMVVNHVPLEQYVASVLGGELPSSFHMEAFCAQAVAARTYVLHRMLNTSRADWDVAASAASQVYRGLAGESSKTKKAQLATRGEVLVYNHHGRNEIICAFYSSTCGGGTRPAWELKKTIPHIKPLGGVKIDQCSDSPHYRWGKHVSSKTHMWDELAKMNSQVRQMGQIAKVRIISRTPQGRAKDILITNARGQKVTVSAETVRIALGLKSTRFDIVDKPNEVWFTNGRGWGHGMGMCQYGAQRMAQQGNSYQKILETYYPGSRLVICY